MGIEVLSIISLSLIISLWIIWWCGFNIQRECRHKWYSTSIYFDEASKTFPVSFCGRCGMLIIRFGD
jgi:membrane protein CcdC involved in cytochrome C biogenesis